MLEIKIDNISMVPDHWSRYIIVMGEKETYYLDLGPRTQHDSRILKEIYSECPTLFMWEE